MRTTAILSATLAAACSGGGGGGGLTITAASPAGGPLAGGQSITLTGEGFVQAGAAPDQVLVGGGLAPQVSAVSDHELVVVTPPGLATGPVDVLVFNNNGFTVGSALYTYNPAPALTAVDPPVVDREGGATLTLTGTGFQALDAGDVTVRFGDVAGTDVTVKSDTELTVVAPAGAAFERVDLVVANANGASNPLAFLYDARGLLGLTNVRSGPGLGGGQLYFIDVDTGAATLLGPPANTPIRMGGLARASDGNFYATSSPPVSLYRMGLDGTATLVAPVTGTTNGICDVEADGDRLYAWSHGVLGTLDPATAVFKAIGQPANLNGGGGLALMGGTMYVTLANQLHTVDLGTGLMSQTFVALPINRASAMATIDGELYLTDRFFSPFGGNQNATRIFRVNPETGAAAQVAVLQIAIDAIAATR